MNAALLVIVAVNDGWVLFAAPGSTEVLVRRTVETHEEFTRRRPVVGDTCSFRAERGFDDRTFYYYAASELRKGKIQ